MLLFAFCGRDCQNGHAHPLEPDATLLDATCR
jgi:hypothetical protein